MFWAAILLAPAFLGLVAFYLWPLVDTLRTSFTKAGPFGGGKWVGLDNYRRLIDDREFWRAVKNSAIYTGFALTGVPIAVVLASLIHQVRHRRGLYRVLFFLPVVTLPVAVAMVWRLIFNGDFGILNWVLGLVGVSGEYWVADPRFTIFAMGIVGIWMGLGVNLIILGAGLQVIPGTLYEAAELDGASRAQQFWRITLPLLSPTIFFVTVLTVISALQMFDLVFIMLRGTNNTALAGSKTIVYLFYEKAFVQSTGRGYGAAIAMALLVLIMIVTAIQFRAQRKWVFYE